MPAASLDDFMALNDQLAALQRAGVPLDVGLGGANADLTASLERINAAVARRVSQGASLEQALESEEIALPGAYRCLVRVGMQSGDFGSALGGFQKLARSVDDSRHAIRLSLLYPLIVCCAAYAGLVGFCLYFVPPLESLYRSLWLTPGVGLSVLLRLRDALPYWVGILPAVLVLWFVWRLSRRTTGANRAGADSGLLAWLPAMSHAIYLQRCANFADALATLLESGMPLPAALRLAAGAAGETELRAGVEEMTSSARPDAALRMDSAAARRFPPFLRWAIFQSEATTGRDRALRMAARLYRDHAQRDVERVKIVAPLVACVVLGGGVTLLYGLALFVPIIDMFRQLAV
jgi:type II secretory pathway component PulF